MDIDLLYGADPAFLDALYQSAHHQFTTVMAWLAVVTAVLLVTAVLAHLTNHWVVESVAGMIGFVAVVVLVNFMYLIPFYESHTDGAGRHARAAVEELRDPLPFDAEGRDPMAVTVPDTEATTTTIAAAAKAMTGRRTIIAGPVREDVENPLVPWGHDVVNADGTITRCTLTIDKPREALVPTAPLVGKCPGKDGTFDAGDPYIPNPDNPTADLVTELRAHGLKIRGTAKDGTVRLEDGQTCGWVDLNAGPGTKFLRCGQKILVRPS